MKIGDSVKVKKGVSVDDLNVNIEGWQGRIIEIDDELVTFELDCITLSGLSDDYIIDSITEGLEFTLFNLEKDELEIVQPRDTQDEVDRMQVELESRFSNDEEKKRITAVLGTKSQKVNEKNQDKYFEYLKEYLVKPCILKSQSDFPWEESHFFGFMSEQEHKRLAKDNPSCKDTFEFIDFDGIISVEDGICIKVKRLSDRKRFDMLLRDLEVVDKRSPNFLLVSDYSSWMTNY